MGTYMYMHTHIERELEAQPPLRVGARQGRSGSAGGRGPLATWTLGRFLYQHGPCWAGRCRCRQGAQSRAHKAAITNSCRCRHCHRHRDGRRDWLRRCRGRWAGPGDHHGAVRRCATKTMAGCVPQHPSLVLQPWRLSYASVSSLCACVPGSHNGPHMIIVLRYPYMPRQCASRTRAHKGSDSMGLGH